MLDIDFFNKKVLDFGTGTGVLAILAQKMGAYNVLAIDYDENCITNAQENINLNSVLNISLKKNNSLSDETGCYDIILSNITRNIILLNLPDIARLLIENGTFVASGFYVDELSFLKEKAILPVQSFWRFFQWLSCCLFYRCLRYSS